MMGPNAWGGSRLTWNDQRQNDTQQRAGKHTSTGGYALLFLSVFSADAGQRLVLIRHPFIQQKIQHRFASVAGLTAPRWHRTSQWPQNQRNGKNGEAIPSLWPSDGQGRRPRPVRQHTRPFGRSAQICRTEPCCSPFSKSCATVQAKKRDGEDIISKMIWLKFLHTSALLTSCGK